MLIFIVLGCSADQPTLPLLSSGSASDQSLQQQTAGPSDLPSDQPPLSPASGFVTGQQSKQRDSEPVSPAVTFGSLIPIAHRDRPTTTRQQRKLPSYKFTSGECVAFVAEWSKHKTSGKVKKPKMSKKVEKAKSSSGKETVKSKIRKAQEKKDQQANCALSEPDNTTCLYCEIMYSESHVAWLVCLVCKKWACEQCAHIGKKKKFLFWTGLVNGKAGCSLLGYTVWIDENKICPCICWPKTSP